MNILKLKKKGIKDAIIIEYLKSYESSDYSENGFCNYLKTNYPNYVEKYAKNIEEEIEKELEKTSKLGIEIISYDNENYPEILRHISNPPLILYKKGNGKIGQKNIGVVGTRKITAYGRSATEKITKELCEGSVCIVSGLAEGVDAAAHEKSLNLGNKTVAVVGSGLDVIYPSINKKIWERISEEGIIFSEYPPGTEPLRWNFPARNRIIVGLSKGIVVTESYKNGGALITAGLALEESRDVFAVPGFINYPSYEGCNNIIKKGEAKLVTSGYDILEEYGWENSSAEEENSIKLNSKEMSIYGAIVGEKDLDEIADEVKMMPSEILAILMEMEIKGIVKSIPGGRYKTIKIISN